MGAELWNFVRNAVQCYFQHLQIQQIIYIAVDGNEYESIDLLYLKDVHLKSYDWRREDWG